jgi:hypothetical protein
MRAIAIAVFAIAAAAVTGPAAASGGIGCEASDQSLTFEVGIGVSRGTGGAFFNLKATLDIAMEGVPEDLKHLTLDDALVHSWLDADELRLQFYTERQEGDFASVDFTVETRSAEEGSTAGEYILTVFETRSGQEPDMETWSAQGRVTCIVE